MDNTREQLAEYAHEAWSGWMRHLFKMSSNYPPGLVTIPAKLVMRWMRQMDTDYIDLLEEEKDSDRKEADKMLEIMRGQNENQNYV